MANKKVTTSRWARLAVDYYRNPKILEAGPIGELTWLRLIAIARENIASAPQDGAIVEILVSREIRDITDLYTQVTGKDANSLLDHLVECGLIRREDGIVIIEGFTEWQTTKEELAFIQSRRGK